MWFWDGGKGRLIVWARLFACGLRMTGVARAQNDVGEHGLLTDVMESGAIA